jgi:amyloid beta precursor protein binding protein 1
VEKVWNILQQIALRFGVQCCTSEDMSQASDKVELTKNHAIEVVRYGGVCLHNISSLIGGVAAQESIKILTHQYIPLNNTFVYNGIAGCAATYDF